MLLAVTRFYTANGSDVINPGYGDFAPPKNEAEAEARLQSLLKKKQYLTSGQRAQAKSEYNQTVELLHAALEAPMFERYSGKLWHGSHVALVDALLEKGSDVQFPGFMSTTYDPSIAVSFMTKGGLIVVNAEEMDGAKLEEISNAPGEKEVLIPAGTSFKVEQSYTIHLEKIKSAKKLSLVKQGIFDKENIGKSTVRVTTPEMDLAGTPGQSDPEGERKLADLIQLIKQGSPSLEPQTKVVILSPEISTVHADSARQARNVHKEEETEEMEEEFVQIPETVTRQQPLLLTH